VVTAHDAADNTTSTSFDVDLVDPTHVTIDLSSVGHAVSLVDTTALASGTDVTVTGSSTGGDGIATGDGDDQITTHGESMALAGDGEDVLNGASDEAFYGEAGSDTITFTGTGSSANYYGLYDPTAGSTDRDYTLERTAANTWVVTALAGATDLGTDTVTGADSLGFEGSGSALATADLISLLNSATGSINENSAAGISAGLTAVATDTADDVHYTLEDDDGGRFAIDANTGEIKAGSVALDREVDGATRQVTVRATSDDGSFTERTYTINLGDVNDIAPVFATGISFTIEENAADGTAVTTVQATDGDATAPNNAVTYSITGGTGLGKFDIDSLTGAVTVHTGAVLDREGTEKLYDRSNRDGRRYVLAAHRPNDHGPPDRSQRQRPNVHHRRRLHDRRELGWRRGGHHSQRHRRGRDLGEQPGELRDHRRNGARQVRHRQPHRRRDGPQWRGSRSRDG